MMQNAAWKGDTPSNCRQGVLTGRPLWPRHIGLTAWAKAGQGAGSAVLQLHPRDGLALWRGQGGNPQEERAFPEGSRGKRHSGHTIHADFLLYMGLGATRQAPSMALPGGRPQIALATHNGERAPREGCEFRVLLAGKRGAFSRTEARRLLTSP